MFFSRNTFEILFLFISFGHPTTIAQGDSTDASNNTCAYSPDLPVNATGSVPFRFLSNPRSGPNRDDIPDWILTTEVRVEASDEGERAWQQAFISVPGTKPPGYENNTLRACIYEGPPLNVSWTAPRTGSESCNGVLSQECVDTFRRIGRRPIGSLSCEVDSLDSDDLQAACGWSLTSYSDALELSNPATCSVPSSRIPVPDGYRTFGLLSTANSNTGYDLVVRQVTPYLVSAAWDSLDNTYPAGDQGEIALCVGPTNITQGSREPTLPPFEEGGTGNDTEPDAGSNPQPNPGSDSEPDSGAPEVLTVGRFWSVIAAVAGVAIILT